MAVRKNYYLPYLRQGIAALADPSSAPGKRTVIPVKVNVRAEETGKQPIEETVEQEIALYGPGDVLGIDDRVVSRRAPSPDTENFEPSLTPFIQFAEPDLLWRYSTRKAADNRNWLPWLSLVVLKIGDERDEGEFVPLTNQRPGLPPRVQLKAHASLPDLKESWRWAHVHVLEVEDRSTEQIRSVIQQSPKRSICRLLSPRLLEPETRYQAFVVPTYRIGMEAGLGFVDGVDDRTVLSWDTPAEGAGKTLPYYLQWKFRTGVRGEFEFLVRILKPRVLKGMGTRTIDCRNPGYGLQPDVQAMEMEGALRSLDTQYQRWGMDEATPPNPTQKKLAGLLNKREETSNTGETILRVTPPVYAEWHAGTNGETVKVDPNKRQWLEELNLDFRHRAVAGLGTQFVKQNQESLMKAAWEQFTKVKMVNRALNLGRFGRQVSLSMHKRLDAMPDDSVLRISLPLQHKIASRQEATATTVSAALRGSAVAPSLSRLTFKKIMTGKVAVPAARTASVLSRAQSLPSFTAIAKTKVVTSGFQMQGLASHHPPKKPPDPIEPDPQLFPALGQATRAALHPVQTIENKLSARFHSFRQMDKGLQGGERRGVRATAVQPAALDPLRPVMWYPEFHRPMYRFLRDLSQDYILPGLNDIPPNTVGLLQTNRRFIEAFMVGLNHEFASELRWREFPTDMRGSYFRSFWDTSIYSLDAAERVQFQTTDVGKSLLQQLAAKYGVAFDTFAKIEAAYAKAETPSEAEKDVADAYEAAVEQWLLTREEDKDIDRLSEWRADTRLGNHPAPGNWNDEEENDNQIVLVIRGELLQKFGNTLIYLTGKSPAHPPDPPKPDLTPTGTRLFPIFEGAFPPDTVFLGFPITTQEVDDYFLIFEERVTELRFGLDVEADGTGENDFSWQHFSVSEGEYLDGRQPTIFQDKWNSAAFIAKVMTQKQVRAAVELTRLMPAPP